MCGIVGQIGPGACGQESLVRMMGMLTHRGPDEAGFLLDEELAFGHLRLSIVDLSSGQQPMATADGRYWVTFNGEIFNHIELRRELEQAGQPFRTKSDTEVVLNAFRAWGPACLDRFNGQWAFALWDRDARTAFLARDRFGVRPLFYTMLGDGRTMIFASEVKAILADDRVSRAWDLRALGDIFASWAAEGDRTPFAGIRQLPAGSWMQVRDGRVDIRKWWDVDYSPDLIDVSRTDESWREELRAALDEACRLRLRADVTVGTYLSGGLDSSITTWLSKTRHQPDLQTFSIGFKDAGYDESRFQTLLAEELGTRHHAVSVSREEIAANLRKAIWHTETPMHRTAPVPLMRLSRLVKDTGLKVVLTGEGADEVFGGYDQFKENKIRRFWARSPGSPWRRRLLDRLEGNVPRTGRRTRAFWYAFYEQGLRETDRPGYSHHPRWRNGLSLLPLLADPVAAARDPREWIAEVEATAPTGFDRWDPLSQAQYWEIRQFLAGYLLSSQGDRVSMANAVEGRYPFLDINVFELSRRMPPRLKLRVLREKDVLKRAFQGALPPAIVQRPKYPYRAPDAMALVHGPCRDEVLESLGAGAVARRGLFRPDAVARLLERVQRTEEPAARDNMALVLAYTAHAAHDQLIDGVMRPAALPPLTTRVDLRPAARRMECHTT
ncbi:MAG: asparagine synthase (glutamine-hydrolyzing) [Vicinamibacterales bacterium]